ncbi:MAG TPA: LPD38 domain-containing protein, partial [Candidatus Paceibacterota bacterium]
RESLGVLTKIIAAPARLLRAGATLSPEFIARNPVRDQFSAFVFSTLGRGYVPFYDFATGLGSVLTKGEGYQNWLKSGGANSAMVSVDRNYVENLVRALKDPSILGTVKNVVHSPLDLLRAASELMENATRVGENMRMRNRGASPEEAGFASREVTLDFQRMGSKMRAVNSIIAFFNAQVEGVDRAVRSMIEQPLGFTAKVGAAITLPSLYLWAANKDDPRMKEIPRWEKDLFWIIPTDNWQPVSQADAQKVPQGYARQRADGQWEINKGNIYRVPKPFELGVMFGSVPERIMDAYYHKDPNAFKNVFNSLQQAFMPNFVPQVAAPVIEQFSNRSLFTDRPLVPQYLQSLLPQYQSNPYTTDTAKMIGAAIAKIPGMSESSLASPIMVENYIRAWTGGLGRHALDLSDAILQGSGVAPTKVQPTLTNSDKALIKAFAVRFPEAGANSIQDFYEEYNKRSQIKKTATYLRKTGAPEDAQDLIRQNALASAEGIHKAIGAQMKMVRDTYRNPKMTP